MLVVLEVSHRHSLHEALDEDRVAGLLLERIGEVDLLIADEVPVENGQILLLDVEVNLVNQCLL